MNVETFPFSLPAQDSPFASIEPRSYERGNPGPRCPNALTSVKLQLSHVPMNVETSLPTASVQRSRTTLQLSHVPMNVETPIWETFFFAHPNVLQLSHVPMNVETE